ncbi:MAG: DUF5818 domain-containing protein [Terriglobia bacterium]
MQKKLAVLGAVLLWAATGLAAQRLPSTQTFTGAISDSACGLHHMMPGASPQKCTLECVGMGAKFVLANRSTRKVYGLSDQAAARPYAGERVKVTGARKGAVIEVTSIQPISSGSK